MKTKIVISVAEQQKYEGHFTDTTEWKERWIYVNGFTDTEITTASRPIPRKKNRGRRMNNHARSRSDGDVNGGRNRESPANNKGDAGDVNGGRNRESPVNNKGDDGDVNGR